MSALKAVVFRDDPLCNDKKYEVFLPLWVHRCETESEQTYLARFLWYVVCSKCPVNDQCFAAGMANPEDVTIRAGTTKLQRRNIRRRRHHGSNVQANN